jgi:pyruvate kinase
MRTRLLCTLGPASLRPDVIAQLDEREVDLFRLNLSHTPREAIEETIDFVQQHSETPICLDTEGAQVRCGAIAPGASLVQGRSVTLTADDVVGDGRVLPLRPASAFGALEVGNVVSVDFHGVLLRVTSVGGSEAQAQVLEGGAVGSNKAVTIDPAPYLPAFTTHDLECIAVGVRKGIRHVALSFARDADDLMRLRTMLPADAYVIAKIESVAGVQNVDRLTNAADAVLIDRGDLSRELPIEHVPLYQKHIIRRANAWSKPVFVATNLLESMRSNLTPTLAEANDIINTLVDGAHGLVLAAETATGRHPVQSVDMVLRCVRAFEDSIARPAFEERLRPATVA